MLKGLFRTKDLQEILASADEAHGSFKRVLGPVQVTLLGIGAIIGAGIFSSIATAALGNEHRLGAGPSLIVSFVLTAVVCAFTALCYAEFASRVPISGSAYTYSYATLGEFVAWIIGWDLIIEYAIGNVAVAISWANYFRGFLETLGIDLPRWLTTDYQSAAKTPELLAQAPHLFGIPIVFNVLAAAIVGIVTIVLVWGIRESARFNAGMVIFKILILAFFVGAALSFMSPGEMAKNLTPFQPNGWAGTFAGAAVIFFSFIGFDAVSTVAEETKKPARDLPIGIFASLAICTLLYVIVAATFAGLIPFGELKTFSSDQLAEPLSVALQRVAPNATWPRLVVALGSVVATTAVLLVFQLGQPRIFFAMARDGLLPKTFARVHPKYKTPHVTTILTGVLVGAFAGLASIDEMVELTNIGTLFAFVVVCVGIPLLRARDAKLGRDVPEHGFRVPLGPYLLPFLGAAACVFLMVWLPPASWWRFVGWLVLGLAVYSGFGYCHSTVGRKLGRPEITPTALKVAGFGFLAAALGLFFIPHDAGITELMIGFGPDEGPRGTIGRVFIAVGLLSGVGGWIAQRRAERS